MSLSEIKDMIASPDEETRRSALQALKSLPVEVARDLLFTAMGDESWRVRKEAVELFVSNPPRDGDLDCLVDFLRNEDNAGLRNSAAEAVIRQGVFAVAPLQKKISDPDPDVRKFIIDVMGAIGNSEFTPSLLEALNDKDVNVASAAAEHLGVIGDSSVLPQLIQAIVSNDAVLFRFSALAALALLASPAPVPDEIKLLADQDILRKAVYDCLGSISDETSADVLIKGIVCRQKSARISAVKALYKICTRCDVSGRQLILDQLRKCSAIEFAQNLQELSGSSNLQLNEALIWINGILKSPVGLDMLIQAFADERLSGKALAALKAYDAEGLEQIVSRYDSAEEDVKSSICILLGELQISGVSKIVRKALSDPAPNVRSSAVITAGKLGLAEVIPELVNMIEDVDSRVRSAVVASLKILALIDRGAVAQVAIKLSESTEAEQRRNASILFAALGDAEKLSLLVKDESALVRQASVEALGALHITSAVNQLIMALVDEDPDVRIAAAESLGDQDDHTALSALEKSLGDEDGWVQSAALKAIARIAPEKLLTVVKPLYSTAEGLLLITCIDVLDIEGSNDALQIIKQLQSSPDQDISRHATATIERRILLK